MLMMMMMTMYQLKLTHFDKWISSSDLFLR